MAAATMRARVLVSPLLSLRMASPLRGRFATLTPELNSIQYTPAMGWITRYLLRTSIMALSIPLDSLPQASPCLQGRSFEEWRNEFDRRGFLIFERVLPADRVAAVRAALAPHLGRDLKGRNDFEGLNTNRVYALLAKSPVFAELVIHPLVLAFVEAELGPSCLLSAFLAINLHPGETVQPWHTDDGGARLPRPQPALGVSTFWAIDDTTEVNGSTEVIPGSHLWDERRIEGAATPADFNARSALHHDHDPGHREDAVKLAMRSGSLAIAKGTLWHRGGSNRSDRPRLIITPQYCAGWLRQLENMCLAVPPDVAENLPERARELIGYSIHPPFMGYVDGVHPKRLRSAKPAPSH
jgi:ectoine hydroxylase-related dioxygenase (phytanoyl-CoA dioxygenase family)